MENDILLSVLVGLGLAAACGFRVFVPLLVMSLASRGDYLQLAEGFSWIASDPAVITFGAATALEILAYYVPWLDNLLDGAATPSAIVAGVVASASQIQGMDPWLTWSIAAIGGGGVAGSVQGLTVLTRQVSLFATGGFGNPLVSTAEAASSVGFALLAIVMPLVAVGILLVVVFLLLTKVLRHRSRAAPGSV
ncbi:MAG: DUF4126 domain-containing protein [Acidobacteriota bacterium]